MLSLYNRNIYHLDLKLNNILYSSNSEYSPYGRYFITDFGISLKISTLRKKYILVKFKPYGINPQEIAYAKYVKRRCIYNYTIDLWSIGIIMGEFSGKIRNRGWTHPIISGINSSDQIRL